MITDKASRRYLVVFLSFFIAITVRAIDIKTTDGREFKNADVLRQEPDRITIAYPKGGATIYLHELTDDLQKHFNYDPQKAQQYRQDKREQDAIESSGVTITWRVSQLVSKEVALGYTYLDGDIRQICVVGPFADHVVDDRLYHDKVYAAGRYTFTTVAGAQRTVSMYGLTPEIAQGLKSRERNPIPNKIQEVASSGTGWLVEGGLVVTCWHVVEDKKTISILSPSLNKQQVTVLAKDANNDIVLLALCEKAATLKGLPLAIEPPALGQEVFTIGYPLVDVLGKEPKVSSGIVSALSGMRDDARFLQVTVPVQPGNSGGPLLTRKGEVVGIITSKLSALAMLMWSGDIPENVNFAVKSRYVLDLLKSSQRQPPQGNASGQDAKVSDVVKATQDAVVMVLAE